MLHENHKSLAHVNSKHEIVDKKLTLIFQSKHCQTESGETQYQQLTRHERCYNNITLLSRRTLVTLAVCSRNKCKMLKRIFHG